MPAKNAIKEFVADSYYHIYNRGVEKRIIFQDEQDYTVFLSYLKTYLTKKDVSALRAVLADPEASWRKKDQALKQLRLNNFFDTITLISYCLMPNHFHFLIKQTEGTAIDRFMQSLFTRYTMYFNKKYHRVGPLFQGVYKAVRVETDEQLLHLSRYIHRNPASLASQGESLRSYSLSSYPQFLGLVDAPWVKPDAILDFFRRDKRKARGGYENFVEGKGYDEETFDIIRLKLDEAS